MTKTGLDTKTGPTTSAGGFRLWLMAGAAALVLAPTAPSRAAQPDVCARTGAEVAPATEAPEKAQADETFTFAIPAQPLPKSIADFSAVTGMQVLYTEAAAFEHWAPALNGPETFTPLP